MVKLPSTMRIAEPGHWRLVYCCADGANKELTIVRGDGLVA